MEACQLTSDYHKEYVRTNKRIPLILRKHINECEECQIKIMELRKEIEIDKRVFGKDFERVRLGWVGEMTNVQLDSPAFFQKMREFSEKHKKYILSTIYQILLFFIFKDILL
jgi:hypothetical protein